MSRPKVRIICLLASVLCALTARNILAGSMTTSVTDLNGRPLTFFGETSGPGKPVVFIFILPDCPVCNSYVAEMKRTWQAFPQFEFYRVYADGEITAAEAREHSKEYDFGFRGLLDPGQQLVRKSGASRTPEAAVFSARGKLLYRGRIDDLYVDFGKRRDRVQTHDLQNALRAILKNEPARWPDAPPVGCYIPVTAKAGR